MKKAKIIFFGTSDFSVPALEALVGEGYEVVVITTPNTPVDRKQILTSPPVKLAAQKLGLEVLQPASLKISEIKNSFKIQNLKFEIGIVASYGKIIPKEVIDSFPKGILNIHPSLLPKYRGPSPIQSAILNGDAETGVTIIKIDNQVDHGPILKNQKSRIKMQNYEELEKELAKKGAELLIKTLPDYLTGKIKPKPQDDSQATFTKMITKEDGKADWHKTAEQIYNQFRAFHKWPGLWFKWRNKILKIIDCLETNHLETGFPSDNFGGGIGKIYQENDQLFVPCSKDYLELLKVQLEGGKVLTAKEFINGYGGLLETRQILIK